MTQLKTTKAPTKVLTKAPTKRAKLSKAKSDQKVVRKKKSKLPKSVQDYSSYKGLETPDELLRSNLGNYFGQDIQVRATITNTTWKNIPDHPLLLVKDVTINNQILTDHLWLRIKDRREFESGNRVLLTGRVTKYIREDMTESFNLTGVRIVYDEPDVIIDVAPHRSK